MKRLTLATMVVLFVVTFYAGILYAEDFYVVQTMKKDFAPVKKTKQMDCYYDNGSYGTCTCGSVNCSSGQDGDLQKGIEWPNPRFTDNGDGTVTDNLTGLVWLQNANILSGATNWASALNYCNNLASGVSGLSDGSSAGDWRLPNKFELESLLNLAYFAPAISNTAGTAKWSSGDPFYNVLNSYYWSSTTYASSPDLAWMVNIGYGRDTRDEKTLGEYVWPVRDAK